MLLLFAGVLLMLTAQMLLLLQAEVARPASEVREGMAAMAFAFVGLCLFAIGSVLAVLGLISLLRRQAVTTSAWLVDPVDLTRVRWWTGQSWTRDTQPREPATIELPRLEPDNRRRRRRGLVILVGAGAVSALSWWYPTSVDRAPASVVDGLPQPLAVRPLEVLALNLALPALVVALVGGYLLLTLDGDALAGWSPDPSDDSRLRFWDGHTWTGSTAPRPTG